MRTIVVVAATLAIGCSSKDPEPPMPRFVVVTFNTGTSEGMGHDAAPDDGYGTAQATLSDQHYGDGLAWKRAVEDARRFFANTAADVVAFQEIFHSGDCASVPEGARAGFVCEDWEPGDPTVAQVILGAGYQVACHVGHADKCIAVRRAFGAIRGCAADLCLDGLAGTSVPGCGKGARVGRAVVDLVAGGSITVVNVHGSSGITAEDADCRAKQFRQIFEDLGLGDGPAANGARNIVLGDLNVDPVRIGDDEASAAVWRMHVAQDGPSSAGAGKRFHGIDPVGGDHPPSYVLFDIDRMASDTFRGECHRPGVTEGTAPVSEMLYFDHKPLVCALEGP